MEFSEHDYFIIAKTLQKSRKITIPKSCRVGESVFIIFRKPKEED